MFTKRLRCQILVSSLLFMVLFLVMQNAPVLAYEAWESVQEFDSLAALDHLILTFSSMLNRAKESKAAHPDFLTDLEMLLHDFKTFHEQFKVEGKVEYPESGPKIEVKYLGKTTDKVGSWEKTTPNGELDEHVQISLYFPTSTLVDSVRIWISDADGKQGSDWWWSDSTGMSSPRYAWVLGVFHDGQVLNPNREVGLGRFEDRIVLDCYGEPQGNAFDVGRYLLVKVFTHDGQEIVSLFQSKGVERPFD